MHLQQAGCVYHAHIPDPLEGGSPRITDVDLVNYSPQPITFNPGDAVDINIQRSLGSIGSYYAGNELLPLELSGLNPVIDLNEGHETEAQEEMNVQQTLGNEVQDNNAAYNVLRLLELGGGEINKVSDINEEDEDEEDEDEED